jgi:hypothetical protein
MSDIFDLSNLHDLPPELVGELRLTSDVDSRLLRLFVKAGRPLNLSQLLVGFFRLYEEEKSRSYMMAACYRLVKKGFLEPTKRKGEYVLTDKGKAVVTEDEQSNQENKGTDENIEQASIGNEQS